MRKEIEGMVRKEREKKEMVIEDEKSSFPRKQSP